MAEGSMLNPKKKKIEVERNKFVDTVVKLFASAFYLGYIPVIPGTCGALLGVIIYRYTLMKMNLNALQIFFCYMGFYLVGVMICALAFEVYNTDEVSIIVCDKVLGGMIAMSSFGMKTFESDFIRIVVAFFLVRLYEITKLFPLKVVEEKMPRGWGAMTDDVVAGTLVLLVVVYLPNQAWGLLQELPRMMNE